MAVHYIIDGYNVINKISFLNCRKLRDSRDALLKFIDLRHPQGSRSNKITVVFDGRDGVFNFNCNYGSSIVFTKNTSADDYIKSFVEQSGNPKNIVVVSDDKDIMFYCRSKGAMIMAVIDFIKKGYKTSNTSKQKDGDFSEISYLERKKINDELSRIWLKEIR